MKELSIRTLDDIATKEEAIITIIEADDDYGAITLRCHTLSSREWERAKSRYKFVDQTVITSDRHILLDNELSMPQKKALSELVISVDGVSDLDGGSKDDFKKLFVDPRFKVFPDRMWVELRRIDNDIEKK